MTPAIRSRYPLTASVAAGFVALLALTEAQAQVTVAFGGPTSESTSGVWTVSLSGTTFSNLTSLVPPNNVLPESSISALAFDPNANSGYADLLASNALSAHFFSLPGPSFWPPTNLLSGGCLSNVNSVAVDPAGDILGAGNILSSCEGSYQGLAIFQPSEEGGGSWTPLDNLNTDPGLNPPEGGWGIGSVPDAVVAAAQWPTPTPPLSSNPILLPDDLVVLVGDSYGGDPSGKPVVVRYPQTSIQGCFTDDGCGQGQTLVTEAGLPLNGAAPVSIDVSPVDGSLLIATSDGSIWQLPIVTPEEGPAYYGPPSLYACVVPSDPASCPAPGTLAWGKIRATQQNGNLFVVATVLNTQSSGFVGLFSGSPPIYGPVQTVSVPGAQPEGLAIPFYKTGTSQAGSCFPPMACDPLGDGVELITIRDYPPVPPAFFPPTATIFEQECDVAEDPRIHLYGSCLGHSLPLSQVCPGLSDSTVIPQYVCGSPWFVIVAAQADQIAANSNGLEVKIKSTSTPIFPSSPPCPQNVHILASNDHSQVETTFAEGHNAFENTGFCYQDPGSGSLGPHKTIDGIGFVLDLRSFAPNGTALQQAVAFTNFKIENLETTINQTSVKYVWEKIVLLLAVNIDELLVNKGRYDCAAELVYLTDQFVRRHRNDFKSTGTAGATVREPNGFGDIIGRLANLFLTIEVQIERKSVTWSDWPLAADPHLCHTNECNVSGINK